MTKRNKGDLKKKQQKDVALPETSTEKYYQVSSTLQQAFRSTKASSQDTATGSDASAAAMGGFSLLSTFGADDDDQKSTQTQEAGILFLIIFKFRDT